MAKQIYEPFLNTISEAPRPLGRGFPVRYFPFIVCPLTPDFKGEGYGALAGQKIRNTKSLPLPLRRHGALTGHENKGIPPFPNPF